MSSFRQEDYVLRQIKAIAAMLARIVGLRLGGGIEEAWNELERAYALLLGPQKDLARTIDSSTAAVLLGVREDLDVRPTIERGGFTGKRCGA